MRTKLSKIVRSRWFAVIASVTAGALIFMGIRFVNYQPAEEVHYHSNFGLYVNGQREQFKNPLYYSEIEDSCSAEEKEITANERAHMHENVYDVVHVEDNAVTWGHFFQNLGWVVDNNVIRTDKLTLLPDDDNKITFVLNGEKVDFLVNRQIENRDRLLVNYGDSSDKDIQKYFTNVASTAEKYNNSQDPASCGSHTKNSLRERFQHIF